MRNTILLFLIMLPSIALAEPHWVEVGRPIATDGPTVVYLDDSEVVSEGAYKGYRVKTILATPTMATDGTTKIVAVIAVFQIDCQSNKGRGSRIGFIDDAGIEYPSGEPQWRNIERPPATDTLNAVRLRLCPKAK